MLEDGYLTTADAIAYLRTAPRTLYRLLATGTIPAVRMGHQWRFRKTDLDRWVEERSTRAKLNTLNENAPSSASRPGTRRVLAADDDPAVRDLLTRILSVGGCAVETVPDGLAAIGRLRAAAFDLLITDLQMAGLGGIDLAREAKQLCPEIKVLIITGYPSQASAIEAVNLGVDGYLTKPFGAVDLSLAVARIVAPGAEVEGSIDNRTEIRPPHAEL